MRGSPGWVRNAALILAGTVLAVAAVGGSARAQLPPSNAELVTVTTHGFSATWVTRGPSDSTVCVGKAANGLRCHTTERGVRFHRAGAWNLQPGTRYVYRLRSGGRAQRRSTTNPGSFTTLRPPPGRHLFDFALISDTHIGEQCAGTATTVGGESIPPCYSADDYPHYAERMSQAEVRELNRRDIPLVIDNADVTSHAEYDQVVSAKQIFGRLDATSYIARGSHDRADQNDPDPRCGPDNDCFRAVLFPDRPLGRIFYSFDFRGYHFVVLDSAKPSDGTGDLTDAAQNAFLDRDLRKARRNRQKTFVIFHHPASEYATTYSVPPLIFGVSLAQGQQQFLTELARFPNVVGVLNAHTHRNFVSYSPHTGARVPFIENGPTKEYPGGFSIFHVYSGGYTRSFSRLGCAFCRRWIETTRGEYYGLFPLYTLGTLSARNFTHLYGCDVPTPPPSIPGDADPLGIQLGGGVCPRSG